MGKERNRAVMSDMLGISTHLFELNPAANRSMTQINGIKPCNMPGRVTVQLFEGSAFSALFVWAK